MRNILNQQDVLAELEDELHRYDNEENIQLNLASRRQDDNKGRRVLMTEIQDRLKEYGLCSPHIHFNV